MKFLLFYGDSHPNTGYAIVETDKTDTGYSQNGRPTFSMQYPKTIEKYGTFSDVGFSSNPDGMKSWIAASTFEYVEENYGDMIAYTFEKLGVYHWDWVK